FGLVTNVTFVFTNSQFVLVTNTSPAIIDTVLGVYTGNSLSTLTQVAVNDDLYPQLQNNESTGQNIYWIDTNNIPQTEAIPFGPFFTEQPFSGPSGLRFNAKAGTTYYFAIDSKAASSFIFSGFDFVTAAPTGPINLTWSYKSSGIFRFASEEVDQTGIVNTNTGLPVLLYRAAETETSRRWLGTVNVNEMQSTMHTYYSFDVPGVPVTITRVGGSAGRVMVDYILAGGDYLKTNGVMMNGDFVAQ